MDPCSLRAAVVAAVIQRAGIPLQATGIAAATGAICKVVAAQLSPVIGAQGLDVLFRRALHLTQSGDNSQMPAFLRHLESRPIADAAEASAAFLLQFMDLLATFVGEPLTASLLAPVWGLPPPRAKLPTASCLTP